MKRETLNIERQSNGVAQLQRRISSWALLSALGIGVIFFLCHETAVAKGLILGTCFSIMNFLLLGKSIPMTLGLTRRKASVAAFGSVLTRYILLAIPLVVAVKSVSFDFVAVVVGIFSVQIITLIDYIIVKPILDEN